MTPIEMLYPAVIAPQITEHYNTTKAQLLQQQQAANSAETRGFVFVVGTTNSQQTHNCCSCAPSLRGDNYNMRHNGTEQGRRSPRVMRMRPNTPTRPASGRTTVRGITATRTRKATRNRRDKNRVHHLTTEEMRDVVYRMTLEWVAQADIAQALNITQGRVSQLLNDETKLRTEQWQLTADQWRQRRLSAPTRSFPNGHRVHCSMRRQDRCCSHGANARTSF